MALRIDADLMTSDETPHSAALRPGGWVVSWLPDRCLTRDQAVTAMTIAEAVAALPVSARTRVNVDAWAGELGIPGGVALALTKPAPAGDGGRNDG